MTECCGGGCAGQPSPSINRNIPPKERTFEWTYLHNKDATVVQLDFGLLSVTGASKRKPGDKPDEVLGVKIALARALLEMAAQLVDQEGFSFVETQETKVI